MPIWIRVVLISKKALNDSSSAPIPPVRSPPLDSAHRCRGHTTVARPWLGRDVRGACRCVRHAKALLPGRLTRGVTVLGTGKAKCRHDSRPRMPRRVQPSALEVRRARSWRQSRWHNAWPSVWKRRALSSEFLVTWLTIWSPAVEIPSVRLGRRLVVPRRAWKRRWSACSTWDKGWRRPPRWRRLPLGRQRPGSGHRRAA